MACDEASLADVCDALDRIDARLIAFDRKLDVVISAVPFPYRNAIRKALDNDQADGPTDRPAHPVRSAVRSAVIGAPRSAR